VPLLDNVVNFDFPAKPKLFVHRAGRAARAGRSGTAISLVEAEELPYLMDLTLYLGRTLTVTPAEGAGGGGGGGGGECVELGKFPAEALTAEAEFVKASIASRDDLTELAKV